MKRNRHDSPAFYLKRLINGAQARIREVEGMIRKERDTHAKYLGLCATTYANHPRVTDLKNNCIKNHSLRMIKLEAEIAAHTEDIAQWQKQMLGL